MEKKYIFIVFSFLIIIILYLYQQKSIPNKNTIHYLINCPKFIPKKSNNLIDNPYNIPLSIYQSWHKNMIPANMMLNISKIIDMNPEFDYYLYSDNECRLFIQNNFDQSVVNAFDILIPGAFKSDLWRYCILYINGGIYLDLKFYCNIPFKNILNHGSTIFVKDRSLFFFKSNLIYNAFMISIPNNPVFKYCIDDIVNSCKFKLYKNDPLDITGPGLLAYIVMKYYPDKYNVFVKFIHSNNSIKFINSNSTILSEYSEYRNDQKKFQKTKRYSELWLSGNVYN